MPHSLVLNLLPESPIPPGFTSGKNLHGLFLNLVSSVDVDLGNELHQNQANKAFTLSPLQVSRWVDGNQRKRPPKPIPKKPTQLTHPPSRQSTPSLHHPSTPALHWTYRKPIIPGTPCWWRISLLDDDLFGRLSQLWLNLNPEHPWHLGPANLHITSILGTPQSTQPWANFCNYQQLYDQASDSTRKLTLQFHTPTAFRQRGQDSSMPTAHRVFQSLLRRWNHYSGLEFPTDSLECLQDSQFNVRTEIASDPRQQFQNTGARVNPCNQFTGCVGTVTYRILGKVEPTTIKQLNTLADFALYAGVGRKTPMGMGVTRRIS
ncbi:crispr-associated cas6 family [Leptolyngbya sp. Heron Island J]|uniref:CRISPR-associated endoribonuclease Cas6 n=1 Tax=Leptolyngbya sp. Heron Island J TaxID=1385935 RepID=UPI0003B9E682|nr:CRISPR-associated endoribonuclease Cas6 [Leptolyngbya sp. Heron Island J]ESA33793.1 crispr-associated cas6 family [Leptolyngbya sp. Heron Island J]